MRIQSLRDLHLLFPDVDGFWNTQNLNETESRIRAKLPFGEAAVSSYQIEVVTQAARLFCLQEKMTEAKDFLNCAEICLKDIQSEEALKLKVRFFLEKGRYYSLSMNPTKAIESFQMAWNLVSTDKKLNYLAIDTAFMISITLPNKDGKKWLKMALEMAENSEAESLASRWRCYLYMQTGWQSFDSHDFSSSLSYFEKAQLCCDKENEFLSRILKWCCARVKRAMGQIDMALAIQNEILLGVLDASVSDEFVYLEIAECYQAKQDFSKAAENFEIAYEKLKDNQWYNANFSDELKQILKKAKFKKYH